LTVEDDRRHVVIMGAGPAGLTAAYELMKHEGNDAVASITVFESRIQAQESSDVAKKWVRENLPFMTTPRETAGELVSH